jgi:hypothetical protein
LSLSLNGDFQKPLNFSMSPIISAGSTKFIFSTPLRHNLVQVFIRKTY